MFAFVLCCFYERGTYKHFNKVQILMENRKEIYNYLKVCMYVQYFSGGNGYQNIIQLYRFLLTFDFRLRSWTS